MKKINLPEELRAKVSSIELDESKFYLLTINPDVKNQYYASGLEVLLKSLKENNIKAIVVPQALVLDIKEVSEKELL